MNNREFHTLATREEGRRLNDYLDQDEDNPVECGYCENYGEDICQDCFDLDKFEEM